MNDFVPRIAPDWPSTLVAVLERARRAGPGGVVAFDLDSTVFDNRPRQARILREYAASAGVEPLRRCLALHFNSGGWDLADAWRNAAPGVPWAPHATPLKAFWAERFFTSSYCEDDVEVLGAPRFLAALLETGVRVVYLTGRHEGMREGSVRCMARCGLPVPTDDGQVTLLMKATLREEDDGAKRQAHLLIERMGELLAAFDNEPTHINDYARRFPLALAVHLATDHSGRPVTLEPSVITIPHFAW